MSICEGLCLHFSAFDCVVVLLATGTQLEACIAALLQHLHDLGAGQGTWKVS